MMVGVGVVVVVVEGGKYVKLNINLYLIRFT